jgi:hypothetical protein
MITASAAEISKAIADDPALLRAMHDFINAVIGDADIGALLDDMAARIASLSPFEDEETLTATVKAAALYTLHALALRAMPAQGRA